MLKSMYSSSELENIRPLGETSFELLEMLQCIITLVLGHVFGVVYMKIGFSMRSRYQRLRQSINAS